MGTIEEIKRMQSEGKEERDIRTSLKLKGISDREIDEGLAQAKIKEAVGAGSLHRTNKVGEPITISQPEESFVQEYQTQEVVGGSSMGNYEGYNQGAKQFVGVEEMQPSMMSQEEPKQDQQVYESYGYGQDSTAEQGRGYEGGGYGDQRAYGGYQEYQPYQGAMSADTITEISEQVVGEKLAAFREKIEKIIDFRTIAETRILNIDERLKRIEKIIDRLQLSVLQRVGEYVTDIRDIKTELEETQKSFKALTHSKYKQEKKKHP